MHHTDVDTAAPVGDTTPSGELRAERVSTIGGKAHALEALSAAEIPVPAWRVMSARAFSAALEQRDCLHALDRARELVAQGQVSAASATMQTALHAAAIPEHVMDMARTAWSDIGGGIVAVRSSAIGEDGSDHSFAGQFDSVLGVHTFEALLDAIRTCWASAFSERVIQYRIRHELDPLDAQMAVIVQQQIDATSAGVLFTGDPVSGDHGVMLVSACWGLGEALVSGLANADTYRFDRRTDEIEPTIADKDVAIVLAAAGLTQQIEVAEPRRSARVLTDQQVRELATVGERLELMYGGRAVDIEWAYDHNTLVILQCRPVTSPMRPRGIRRVWDNSNIVESYAGVVSPLTFSFAREAYAGVYLQALSLLRIPPAEVPRAQLVTRQMLGYLDGRVYYNLGSWYYLLSVLPNYEEHKAAMEQMMGVRQTIDHKVVPTPSRGRTVSMALGMAWYLLTVRRRIRSFRSHLFATIAEYRRPWETADADELVEAYEELKVNLLGNWQVPIINDFRVMVFFDKLRSAIAAMGIDEQGTLANDLMCGQGDVESAEPTYMLLRMAAHIRADAELTAIVLDQSDDALHAAIMDCAAAGNAAAAHVAEQLDIYLERFGDRCANELKLETPTLREHPAFLYSVLRNFVRDSSISEQVLKDREDAIRRDAEARVRAHLIAKRFGRIRMRAFTWLLRQARGAVRDREALRFDRTRVFGVVRTLMTALGARLYDAQLIEDPNDVFMLEVDEVVGTVQGTCTTRDLRGLIALRAAQHARWEASDAMPDRVETVGVTNGNPFNDAYAAVDTSGSTLQGIGCCPGIVTRPAHVVHRPDEGVTLQGDIMVCMRTDPGWVPLFPSCGGLLVERGSLLSHSAIVAREFGIPAIVGIPGLMSWARTGELLRMDGTTGVVSRADSGAGDAP